MEQKYFQSAHSLVSNWTPALFLDTDAKFRSTQFVFRLVFFTTESLMIDVTFSNIQERHQRARAAM